MTTQTKAVKQKPDIRAITRLVPREGNLVQGQSELPINPELAKQVSDIIASSRNHYGGSEGHVDLREAIAEKLSLYNGISLDPDSRPFELLVTNGGTGALIGLAQTYIRDHTVLVFEPYYPYHRHTFEAFGGKVEAFELDEDLMFEKDRLLAECRRLKDRKDFPLKAIIVCSPANPSGKVMTAVELSRIADVAKELDLLVISDEVYEHFVLDPHEHISIAALPDMWERTITVNSFSKSWNISGWRLGYVYGPGELIGPLNSVLNIVYVCPATPLQEALSHVLTSEPDYYANLRQKFTDKQSRFDAAIESLGFDVYDSGSAFYRWARIPDEYSDAITFNEMLIREAAVGMVPGSAFADSDRWDAYVRICIAREDPVLDNVSSRLSEVLR